MAERTTSKVTSKVKPAGTAKAPAKAAAKPAAGGALGLENARLKSDLAEALERIADLEMKQADIVNRIDRVIDSLQKLPD
ncbi:MAG: hypothetical protein ABL893_04070 [Hyphomicrobium sp.]|nr:hypothetical protein [Hyphomicrobium sp.]